MKSEGRSQCALLCDAVSRYYLVLILFFLFFVYPDIFIFFAFFCLLLLHSPRVRDAKHGELREMICIKDTYYSGWKQNVHGNHRGGTNENNKKKTVEEWYGRFLEAKKKRHRRQDGMRIERKWAKTGFDGAENTHTHKIEWMKYVMHSLTAENNLREGKISPS